MTKTTGLDETHDPARRSFVEAANQPETDFPIQNLPLGVFSTKADTISRIGVAIGDQVFDLKRAGGRSERLSGPTREALQETTLNRLFSLGSGALRDLRRNVADMLDQGAGGNDTRRHAADLLTPMEACILHLPTRVSNYTDFYAGIHHALNVGRQFRPDIPLLPNYKLAHGNGKVVLRNYQGRRFTYYEGAAADHVIDMGPGAGLNGGEVGGLLDADTAVAEVAAGLLEE